MNPSGIILLCTAIIFSCNSEVRDNGSRQKEFEGIITYKTVLESKTPDMSTEGFQSLFGDTMIFYIKKGNYKMTYNGDDVKDIIYLTDNNNQYTVRRGIDTLFVNSCDRDKNELVSSEVQQETEKILGRECKRLINQVGKIAYHYWYDPNIYINPEHFTKHKFGYVNVYYEKAESVWLKYWHEGVKFNLTFTAIAINETALDDKIFHLPDLPEGTLD